MTALYLGGRTSEALRVHTPTRDVLAELLGGDPGRVLQETFQGILRGDLEPFSGAHVPRRRASTSRGNTLPEADDALGQGRQGGADTGTGTRPPRSRSRGRTTPGRTGPHGTTRRPRGPAGPRGGPGEAGQARRSVWCRPVQRAGTRPRRCGAGALALTWAHRAAPRFPDGRIYVDLRSPDGSPRDPAEVLRRLVRSLSSGVRDAQDTETEESAARARTLLAHRRVPLFSDNDSSVLQVRPLLPGGRGCAAVVTSRYRLTDLLARDGLRSLPWGRSAAEPVRRPDEGDPARGATPTARMAAVLRTGSDGGRHDRGEVPAASRPLGTSVAEEDDVRLSSR